MKSDLTEREFRELDDLINQYAAFYRRKFRNEGYSGPLVDLEELKSILSVKAVMAYKKYQESDNHTASMRTYIITAFRNRMYDYRKDELLPNDRYFYFTSLTSSINERQRNEARPLSL